MRREIIFFAACAALLLSQQARSAAAAEDSSPFASLLCPDAAQRKEEENLLEKVEKRYAEISDLSAKFLQQSYFLGSDETKESGGTVYFKRPGKMDWVYNPPEEQRFTSDGSTVWWYQPKDNQIVLRDLKQSFTSDVPVSFLLGVGKLRESFKFAAKCSVGRGTLISLLPLHANASLDRFFLLVDKKDYSPLGARIVDAGGNETSIIFDTPKLNSGIDGSHFQQSIPKGTDIIDERSFQASSPGTSK